MGGDTKSEPGASPKVGFQGLSDEVRAEVASLVQAALAQMQQPGYDCSVAKTVLPLAEISTTDVETETERNYKEIVSALEAKLSDTNKLLETSYRDLSDARDQLEKQRAKAVQLEQRILQMSQAEGTYKSTLSVLRAEKEKALAREREAMLGKERTGKHLTQLSNQLSDLQSNLDLKTAELNDSIYIRQQLENRINELNKENMSLRRGVVAPQPPQGASTGAQSQPGVTNATATSPQMAQPPANLYFSVPVAGAVRRHTVPNIYPTTSPTTQTVPNTLPVNRPPKRARADSNVSDDSNGTRSRASSGSSMSFALRPVQPEPTETKPSISAPTVPLSNNGYPRYQAYSPVSPTVPVSPQYAQQPQQSTYAAPIAYHNQGSYQTNAAVSQGPSSAPPTMGAAPSGPTMVPAPAQMMQPAPVRRVPTVQQFINQMYVSTPAGFPECKICKVRPLCHSSDGVPMPPSIPDLLGHVEKFHGRTIMPKPAQQQ